MRTPLALAAALALVACNGTPAANETAAVDNATTSDGMTTNTSDPASAAPSVPTDDFVKRAAISDMFEIESAKVAQQRSNNAEVKTFAGQMVADHTATTTELKGIVAKDNLAAPPTALDEPHAKMLADLKAADANSFDTVYLDQQTKAHEDALNLLTGYAAGGENADLKAMAAKTAPKVQGHLDMAKRMDETGTDDANQAKGAGAR